MTGFGSSSASCFIRRRIDGRLPPEAPANVAALWEEAALCQSLGALRGAAACLRGAVEQIVKHQRVPGNDLRAKINGLAASGVDADLIAALHDTRLTGNWTLHDGVAFAPDEVSDLVQLVDDAVQILYVQPAKRAAMATARAARRERGS